MPSRFITSFLHACPLSPSGALHSCSKSTSRPSRRCATSNAIRSRSPKSISSTANFKIALAEYEKFLTLYEKSPGAPYAQLMWSHTMMNLKKPKTALRDGFQSVIDYWPESHEATIAAYCMGDAYRTMGEVKSAQKAFRFLITEYPDHEIAIRSRQDLLHYARLHQDMEERLSLLNELTFKVKRTDTAKDACVKAATNSPNSIASPKNSTKGKKALATTYAGPELFDQVFSLSAKTVPHLLKEAKTRPAALKLGDQLLSHPPSRNTRSAPRSPKTSSIGWPNLHGTLGRPSDTWKVYEEIGETLRRRRRTPRPTWPTGTSPAKNATQARRIYGEFDNKVTGSQTSPNCISRKAKSKKPSKSTASSSKSMATTPATYLWSIAGCYEKLSDWKKAIACYRQVDRFPANYFAIAKCHRRLGEQKEAIVLYNQCKVVEKSAPEATLQIGFTYEEAKDKEKAIRTFQLTCKRYPKSGQASKAHSHLQNKYNINVTLGGTEEE